MVCGTSLIEDVEALLDGVSADGFDFIAGRSAVYFGMGWGPVARAVLVRNV